jgi:hypothetical protein
MVEEEMTDLEWDSQNYEQAPDGSWVPATPLGWMEEHNWLARFIFWVRGIEHCNDREGQKRVRKLKMKYVTRSSFK